MEETQAASSTAVAEAPLEIPRSGTTEYAQWRVSGELPEKKVSPKTEESAPSDIGKDQVTDEAAGSAATQTQEKPNKRRPDIEARFKQYTDRIDRLERELNEARAAKETKADPSPAKQQPHTYKDYREKFKPSQWIEQYGKDHPDASYEDATAAMADHLADVRDQFRSIEQQHQSQTKELNDKVTDARARYGDKFDEVLQPTLTKIISDAGVNPNVKAMLNDSDVIADLIFTIGSDQKTLNDFLSMAKTNPGRALRYIAVVEQGIVDELTKGKSGNSETGRNDKGQFARPDATPAKRGPESAPEPPLEIGARGAGTMNESERAFQAIERGDFSATRAFLKAENAKDLRRRRGV